MAQAYRALLEPLAPFYRSAHTHARRSGALVHSDTLHAALVSVAALTGAMPLDTLRGLRVSSVYPCWRDTLLLPKPFLRPPGADRPDPADPAARKRWKSVRLVTEGLLRAWLADDAAAVGGAKPFGGVAMALAGEVAGKPVPDALVAEDLSPAVTIDHVQGSAVPFERFGLRVNTAKGGGAWFFVMLEEDQVAPFQELLAQLGGQGLGGERGVGYGAFEPLALDPWDVPETQPGAAFLTLSLYTPTREEVEAGVLRAPAAYNGTVRGGWIHGAGGTAQRKRSVRMCVEGSVFPAVAHAHGGVADLAPEGYPHPVWRSGLAFAWPFMPTEGGAS